MAWSTPIAGLALARALFDAMHAGAIAPGECLIAREATLGRLFATRSFDDDSLNAPTTAIGVTQARLRTAHPRTHLATAKILTTEQAQRYTAPRGYADATPAPHPHHH